MENKNNMKRASSSSKPILVDTQEAADKLGRHILSRSHFMEETVLGIDLEGLSLGRPVSLLQLSFGRSVYLVDLLVVSLSLGALREVLEDPEIVKVVHDCCEDVAGLHR